jgi:hypothetical protein
VYVQIENKMAFQQQQKLAIYAQDLQEEIPKSLTNIAQTWVLSHTNMQYGLNKSNSTY